MPGGGPSHAIHNDLIPSTPESASEAADAASDAAKKLVDALPSLTSVLSAVALSPVKGVHSLAKALPPIGAPSSELKAENKEYKANKDPLNADEKKGMYIFGGIVALGLALGGDWSGKSKAGKGVKEKVGDLVDKAKGTAGAVKGDENWEKASGAQVVGHGLRKA